MITNFPIDSPDEDLACFAIWEHARSKETEIINDLEKHFEILGIFHVYWSDQHYNRNVARLYENAELTNPFYRYDKKIGKPPFCFIIVRDNAPVYTYMKTVSGAIEAVNKNIVDRKNEYRTWFEKHYQIHSSCNFNEFSSQAALVLGMQTLEATLQGENKGPIIELKKDLEGADGWQDWQELFLILNYSSHYLILREFSGSLDQTQMKGLEFLCNSYQSFASTANIQQNLSRPYSGTVIVSDQVNHINIRFIGDGYFASSWEKDMLDRRVLDQGVYTPCTEDFFFSLLYHTKIHQKNMTDHDVQTLKELAVTLLYDWFPSEKMTSTQDISAILSGYMRAKKYYHEQPIDRSVHVNFSVVKHLPKLKNIGMSAGDQRKKRWKSAIKRLKHKIRTYFKKSK
ncbi:MAG: hypothetical protein V7776_23585 [Halopseudomonas aestusnigri]